MGQNHNDNDKEQNTSNKEMITDIFCPECGGLLKISGDRFFCSVCGFNQGTYIEDL